MGFHNSTKTELVLELRLNSISSMTKNITHLTKKPNPSSDHPFQPCLTLALSGDSCGGATVCSSFSNSTVKRERDKIANEESERVENTSGEEDEDGGVNGKKKLRLTKAQSGLLEKAFKLHTALNPQTQKQELARDLKLRPRQVEVWFQNRRARTKLKQTEVDCDYLKKCCKTLTEENQRLQQEVQQLKAQKVSQPPLYMATLTMCPACERIEGTNSGTTSSPFTMAHTPYYFNPFSSSSAAC